MNKHRIRACALKSKNRPKRVNMFINLKSNYQRRIKKYDVMYDQSSVVRLTILVITT